MPQITALMDDRPSGRQGLIAGHGLSLFVRYQDRRILFDCGPGSGFLHNARALGIDLEGLDAVVLSHSHYDHAAGFRSLTEAGLGGTLYTGPRFFEPKYSKSGARYTDRSAGFDPSFLERYGVTHREVRNVTSLFPGVWLIGGFPRSTDFETIPDRYVRRTRDGFRADDFADEICMALEVSGGLAVLVGCSHPGIVNMAGHVGHMLGRPVKAVLGGVHLSHAEEERIHATVQRLEDLGLEDLGLGHCSGEEVERAVQSHEHVRLCRLGVGDRVFYA